MHVQKVREWQANSGRIYTWAELYCLGPGKRLLLPPQYVGVQFPEWSKTTGVCGAWYRTGQIDIQQLFQEKTDNVEEAATASNY